MSCKIHEDDELCGFPDDCDLIKYKKIAKRPKWICKREPLWRMYMRKCVSEAKRRALEEREVFGEFYHRRQNEKHRLPIHRDEMPGLANCRLLSLFNQKGRKSCAEARPKTKIWDDIRFMHQYDDCPPEPPHFEWPNLAPCLKRDVVKEKKIEARKLKLKKIGATPCEIAAIQSPESSDDEKMEELAHKKELIHARIPVTHILEEEKIRMERACGERIGLVDGDCIVYELDCDNENRTYANLCLRGLIGMHLQELTRIRIKTWKFCLFQNLIALLVKTQLRYKYAWGENIDYIYEQGWKMFLHSGFLNTKLNQRFDDILVYNYIYDVELQLVHEIKDLPIIRDVDFEYFEPTMKKQEIIQRHKVTLLKCQFGNEQIMDNLKVPVHKGTRRLEKWFDNLDSHYTNCILRTTRFSVAFWQDGLFWFLYNPYRCDKYGLWEDEGYASIMKFCTKDALKRHIMILIIRAYAYKLDESDMCAKEYNYYSVSIYQIIYHSCKIHNIKLYLRGAKKPKPNLVEKVKSDPCLFDPYDQLSPKACEELLAESRMQELEDKIEKPRWLQEMAITWSKLSSPKTLVKKRKWHEFEVYEPRRLYVLWSDIHVTDRIFAQENRNKQSKACYIVCAGMCFINAPEYWTADVLKAIVIWGDTFYTKRRERSRMSSKDRPASDDEEEVKEEDWSEHPVDQFRIGEIMFDVSILRPTRGRLYGRSDQCLWRSLEIFFQRYNFGILECESTQLGVFKHCGAYYFLDAYSMGPPIFKTGDGRAYLLRGACLRDLVTSLILVIGSIECSPFSIRPIEIGTVIDTARVDDCAPKVPDDVVDCSYEAIVPKTGPCRRKDDGKSGKRDGRVMHPPDDNKDRKTICVPPEN